jgi:ABC-type transporter Mla subunit MlaD
VKQRNAFIVGATFLVALALTVAAAIWLGRIQLGSRPEKVSVRFRTKDGLGVGAPVTLRGVKIGTVHSIELADDNWVLATLKLQERLRFPPTPASSPRPPASSANGRPRSSPSTIRSTTRPWWPS